jgi:hypothetical protein
VEYFQYARRNDRPYGIFDTITRISATETEQAVTAAAVVMLADESAVTLSLEKATTNSDRLSCALKSSQSWLESLQSANESVSALVELVTRVDISSEGMRLLLELPLPTTEADEKCRDRISLCRMFPVEMKRRGIEMRWFLRAIARPADSTVR